MMVVDFFVLEIFRGATRSIKFRCGFVGLFFGLAALCYGKKSRICVRIVKNINYFPNFTFFPMLLF